MINTWLGHIQTLMIVVIVLVAIYMVVKMISVVEVQKSKETQGLQPVPKPQKKLINVEITSKDLVIRARNLIEQSEVYGLQMEQCVREIEEIDIKIEEARNPIPELTHNAKLDLSNPTIKNLISQSLKLQERKVKLDEKLIKIHAELDEIAKEELRRSKMA